MTKASLRKEFLAKRMLLTEAEQQQRIKKITTHFAEIQFHTVAFALSYKAMAAKKEVTPALVEEAITHQFSQCHLCYPKISEVENSMEAIEFAEGSTMRNNKWGIAEPGNGTIISPQQINLILVPLLCFNRSGYRVGYGKGFYDRYIARCLPDVITVGLSFFEPVNSIEDVDEYDIPLRFCATPERLYQF